MSSEHGSPSSYPFQPVSQRPFWTVAKITALVLVVIAAVSTVGAGMYYYMATPVKSSRLCSDGATNFPLCTTCSQGQTLVSGTCYRNGTNGATNPPGCNSYPPCSNGANNPPACNIYHPCNNGATDPPACNQYPACTNGANNPPTCTNIQGPFCLAFNFGNAAYSQNSSGWYITLYVSNYCSDRNLYVSRVSVDGTIFPGNWTLPPGACAPAPVVDGCWPRFSTPVVVCMSCAGQVFVPCRIYNLTVWVTGSGTSADATSQQSQGFGWQC